ncbi:MAG: hypothetical protein AB8G22_11450 [Saprospiraceae bacterium]
MLAVPMYLSVSFVLITALTVYLFSRCYRFPAIFWWSLLLWMLFQVGLVSSGFYQNFTAIPPRFPLLFVPTLFVMLYFLLSQKGQQIIDRFSLAQLTILHTIRIPVELVLYGLFIEKAIPEIMTFAGRNWDILAGLTAPVVYYFMFVKKTMSRRSLLIWNVLSLLLVLNIVIHAILSAPSPFQQFGLDQPNIAIFHFPFVWLPSVVVPLVIFAHLVAIRRLIR